MEIWLSIEGYTGYEVSNYGRVRSTRRVKPVILKPQKNWGDKYLGVGLMINTKKNTRGIIHRLVAQAFIPNPDNKPEVNHKDGDTHNNRADNLEWVTNLENIQHAWRTGLSTNAHTFKAVGRYDQDHNLLQIYHPISCAKDEGFSLGNISSCCTGKLKRYKGFIWKFITKN